MRAEHGDAGQRPAPGAQADDGHQEPELADGAVGQQQLDVGLGQCPDPADQHAEHAQPDQGDPPQSGAGEPGRERRGEEDAGLDHRRGVQVGADRGGRGHRAGQPEVERHQGGLGDRAHQHQPDGHGDGGARRPVAQRRHHLVDLKAAGRLAEHHETDEHGQAAERGDDQRVDRRPPVGPALRVVPDQHEGEDRGEFPEHVDQQQVPGQHQAEHGTGERGERPGEPPERRVTVLEVPPAVGQHQGTDAGDQHGQRPAQGVQPQRDVQMDRRHPADGLGQLVRSLAGDLAHAGHQPAERCRRHQGQEQKRAPAEQSDQAGSERGRQEVGEQQDGHAPGSARGRGAEGATR